MTGDLPAADDFFYVCGERVKIEMYNRMPLELLLYGQEICRAVAPETWPTWLACFVGMIAAFIYWKTLRAIQKQTAINEYAQRSWVLIGLDSSPSFGGVQIDDNGTLANFKLTCRNNRRLLPS